MANPSANGDNQRTESGSDFPRFNSQNYVPNFPSHYLKNTNQFQTNYGLNPTHFSPPLQQQFSFQGLMNSPPFTFEPQNPTTVEKSGKQRKGNPSSLSKNSEIPQTIRRNWTKEEDVALTKAWLHNSIDSIIGTDQAGSALWVRIKQTWKEFLADEFVEDRQLSGLSKRWGKIQAAVNKFHGIYEYLERNPKSGTNIDNLRKDARDVYKEANEVNKEFLFEHCWVECKKNAKWCTEQLTSSSSKRQRENGDDPTERNENSADGVTRPPGRTKTKVQKNVHSQDKDVVEILSKFQVSLQNQFDCNKEDLELKRENAKVMKKEYELRENAMKRELELKEKELALKAKSQRRRDQHKILIQDLSKLTPATRVVMEKMQEQILQEWNEEDFQM